jgi:hypothetical protein
VGVASDCGGSGAVVFLSVQDRAMFISRGRALERYLTNSRLDAILEDMKPILRREDYGSAILVGVEEIFQSVRMGDPSYWKEFLFVMVLMTALSLWGGRRVKEHQRQFVEVTSQLSELDRARAEAFQGKYQVTSCPICLESFPISPTDESESSSRSIASSGRVKLDGRLGSDGKPIKLLRCGHCFDSTCFTEWTRTGQGQVDKCPICKAPLGAGGDHGEPIRDAPAATLRSRRVGGISTGLSSPTESSILVHLDPVEALRYYNQERVFRLGMLHRRYPRVGNLLRCAYVCSRCSISNAPLAPPISLAFIHHSSLDQGMFNGGPNPTTKAC